MSDEHLFGGLIKGWQTYQDHLVTAVQNLSAEQLALRAAPGLRSIGDLATHIVSTRAAWTREALCEGSPGLDGLIAWQAAGSPARSAAELVEGLGATWEPIREGLARWTATDLELTLSGVRRDGRPWSLSRGWIVWHLLEHDIHHGGELSFSLGMHGLPGVAI
jgi:uncharacterized damage-inducible protein DinB